MESFGARFGHLVRDKRVLEGLSQDDLASKCAMYKARISELENGKIRNPQAKTVNALCLALGISTDERRACHANGHTDLPPRLLENLALRFGHSNPDCAESDLEAFLKSKAAEFRDMQSRLMQFERAGHWRKEILNVPTATSQRQNEFKLRQQHFQHLRDKASLGLPEDKQHCLTARSDLRLNIGRRRPVTSHS